MVLLPPCKHRYAPLLTEDHRVLSIPFVHRQSKMKLSCSEHWNTAAVPSLRPKPRTKIIPVAKTDYQATSVSLPQQAMAITSQCPKPMPRTMILSLPFPAHRIRKTDLSLSRPQNQLNPLNVDPQIEEPSVHNRLPQVHREPTYLPKIPQGCDHTSEGPSHHNFKPIFPQCSDFQVEVPQCPGHKTKTTAVPFPTCWVKATGMLLSCLNHQSEISPSLMHRDKQAISQLLCLKSQRKTIITASPGMNHPHRSRTILSSLFTKRTRDINVLTNQGPNHPQTGRPLRSLQKKSRTKIMVSSVYNQQLRVMAVSSSSLVKTTSTRPNLLAEISKCPIDKIQSTHVFLPPSDPQAKTAKISYTSSKGPPVSNQRNAISLGSDHGTEVLSKLRDCIRSQQGPNQQQCETLPGVNDQARPFLGPQHQVSRPSYQSPATPEHLAGGLLHLNNRSLSQRDFQHQGKAFLDPIQGEKILPSLNYGLKVLPVSKPRTIFNLNYNYFAEVMTDTDHQTRKEISSCHQTETSPNTNQKIEVELGPDYQSESTKWPDIRAQIPTCFDHFSEGSPESNHQATLPSGLYKLQIPLNPDCQVLPSPSPHHWSESEKSNDPQTKCALGLKHFCEPEFYLDNWTKSSLDFNHQVLAAPAHNKAILGTLQNTRTQPKLSHRAKTASGLDHCYEIDLALDCRKKSSLNSNTLDQQPITIIDSVKKSIAQSSLPNQVKDISGIDHSYKLNLDLGHREKSLLNSKYQVKAFLEHNKKTKPTMNVIQKSTNELSLQHQANSISDPDQKKEIAMFPNFQNPILSVPGHQPKVPLSSNYLPEFSPKSKDQVEDICIDLISPNQTFGFPRVPEKDPNNTLGPGKWPTLKRGPANLTKFPLGYDHEAKTPTNLQQSLPQLLLHSNHIKTVSNPLSQDQVKNNRASTWCFKYFKPYTIGHGDISKKAMNKIIVSIPKDKIKNDIQKQILLRRLKISPNSQPGSRLSCSYPVCLICASWVPHGCIHNNMVKKYGGAQLIAIPMPVPGSKMEMGIKFVLQIPEGSLPSTSKRTIIMYSTTHTTIHQP